MLRFLIRVWFVARAIVRHPFSSTLILETEDGCYYTGSGETHEQALAQAVKRYETSETKMQRQNR